MVEYDVIVVGGRVAGAALAARLGKYGLRVLLLERGTFPSLPAVSSPIIYAPTMKMLDEIGADENAYARSTPRLYAVASVTTDFSEKVRLPDVDGRDYAYAIDRARFDDALWQTAVSYPTVDGRQGYSVRDLLWDGDQVVGVIGKSQDGDEEEIRAKLVVGADGRFSLVARKVNAAEMDQEEGKPTSIYYAYWRNVESFDDEGPIAATYEGSIDTGYGYLIMDSADGQTVVCVEGRAETINPGQSQLETHYVDLLKQNPEVWRRMEDAERVTTIRGMKHISNLYRQAGGDGWALVGDAYHQKDPLDGQGIYNAVMTSKLLAIAIRRWLNHEMDWQAALAWYDEQARVKTYPMYKVLHQRISSNFYAQEDLSIEARLVMSSRQVMKWVAQDEQIKDLTGKMLTRQIPPDLATLMSPPLILGAIARGSLRELRKKLPL